MDLLEPDPRDRLPRRKVLVAAAGTVAGAVALTACGSGDSGGTPATSKAPAGAAPKPSGPAGSGGGGLAQLADVPVGGAVSAQSPDGKPMIVSQPTKGNVVAFSAICTHMGCTVAPAGSELKCPCHGSTYDLATGKNTGGPAPRPLTEVPVKVSNGEVVES